MLSGARGQEEIGGEGGRMRKGATHIWSRQRREDAARKRKKMRGRRKGERKRRCGGESCERRT